MCFFHDCHIHEVDREVCYFYTRETEARIACPKFIQVGHPRIRISTQFFNLRSVVFPKAAVAVGKMFLSISSILQYAVQCHNAQMDASG